MKSCICLLVVLFCSNLYAGAINYPLYFAAPKANELKGDIRVGLNFNEINTMLKIGMSSIRHQIYIGVGFREALAFGYNGYAILETGKKKNLIIRKWGAGFAFCQVSLPAQGYSLENIISNYSNSPWESVKGVKVYFIVNKLVGGYFNLLAGTFLSPGSSRNYSFIELEL